MGEDFEFNLQGFSVTPEELELIKPQHNWACSLANPGELAIDSIMMKQLSAAGMSIGRQVESGGVDIVLQSTLNREVVEKFCDEHDGITIDVAEQIFKMIKQLTDDHRETINLQNVSKKILDMCMSMNSGEEFEELETDDVGMVNGKGDKAKKKKIVKRKGVTMSKDTILSETDQIVKVLTTVMMEILKNDEVSAISQNGSLVSHHNTNGHVNGNQHKNKAESVYEIISNVLNDSLKTLSVDQLQHTFSSANTRELVLEKLSTTIHKVETLCRLEEMKQNLMNAALGLFNGNNVDFVNNGDEVMEDNNEYMVEQFCNSIDNPDVANAFSAMTKNNPKLLMEVINSITNNKEKSKENVSMEDLIQNAIVEAVKQESNHKLDDLIKTKDVVQLKSLLNESVTLAKTLGMSKEATTIMKALEKAVASGDVSNIKLDDAAKAVIQRMCVMKQLANVDPEYQEALEILTKSPEKAAKSRKVRKLVRNSGLMAVPVAEKEDIKSSNDIPVDLMNDENSLAMEEYLLKKDSGRKPVMIIKDGVQLIFPREKTHDVLAGKCAYTLINEKGIHHIEPAKKSAKTEDKVETINKFNDLKKMFMTADAEENVEVGGKGIKKKFGKKEEAAQIKAKEEKQKLVEQFCDFVDDPDMASAFSSMSKTNPQLLMDVLNSITNNKDVNMEDISMKDLVQNAIIEAVKQESSHKLDDLIQAKEVTQIKNLLNESVTLAKALGMSKEATTIMAALDKAIKTGDMTQFKLDDAAKEVIQRMCVMKQLAESEPEYQEALDVLTKTPEKAVKNEVVRKLVRKSGLISIPVAEDGNKEEITSLDDIPVELMKEENVLAMEDYLLKKGKGRKPVLIIKNGVQLVFPRNKTEEVLAGKCEYTLINENGIQNVRPPKKSDTKEEKTKTINKLNDLKKMFTTVDAEEKAIVGGKGIKKKLGKKEEAAQIKVKEEKQKLVAQFCDFVDDLDMASAFTSMSKTNPQLFMDVLNSITNSQEVNVEGASMKDIIQNAIVKAVKQESSHKLDNLIKAKEVTQIKTLLNESVTLAKALGMSTEATTIMTALDKAIKSGDMTQFKLDDAAKEVIERMCVMKQLAETDPEYQEALNVLTKTPEKAVKNEVVRKLVRKSGLISIPIAEDVNSDEIQSLDDIPVELMSEDNTLAMEDYLLKKGKGRKPVLIVKNGVQLVFPRDKTDDVLAGKCEYTIIDESGIKHFEPTKKSDTKEEKAKTLFKFNDLKKMFTNVEAEEMAIVGSKGTTKKFGKKGDQAPGPAQIKAKKEKQKLVQQFCDYVDDPDVAIAFSAMAETNPQLLMDVLTSITNSQDVNMDEISMKDIIQNAIVQAVKHENSHKLDNLIKAKEVTQIKALLNESVNLAKALGRSKEATTIMAALEKAIKTGDMTQIKLDDAAKEVIERMCVMKQLAETDPDYEEALEVLTKDPQNAGKDEVVRELVRKSGIMSTPVAEDSKKEEIQSLKDIPIDLMTEENALAMEDYLLKRGQGRKPVLVIKNGVQTVFPRDKTHDVLSGKCEYTLIDKDGIRNVQPAKKLNTTEEKKEKLCKFDDLKKMFMNANGEDDDGIVRTGRKVKFGKTPAKPGMPNIQVNDNDFIVDQFCDFVDDIDVASAFSAMTKNNPQLLMDVLNSITNNNDVANENISMKDLIQNAIVKAVKQESNHKLDDFIQTQEVSQIESLLNESLVLAKALGMSKEAMTILAALDKTLATGDVTQIKLDDAAKAVIQRMCIMKQLAEVDPDYQEALELLTTSPHRAVKDEIVRELVRKSGLISIPVVEKQDIQSSNDIPAALMNEENVLAMEDYLLRNGSGSKAFLIIKDGVQCVVPREKSHDVLTGKCAYTVLDENGVRHFEPLHVMNALKLNTPSQHHRFSIYANDETLNELNKLRQGSTTPTYDVQSRDFQFSACDFADGMDIPSSENDESSENGTEFGDFFVKNKNYEVDADTGYRRPRRRRLNDKDDPTSNLDFQTTLMLSKRRGARPDRVSKAPITTQVYRQYTQVNDNIYIMHAYVLHGKKEKGATAAR